MVSTQPVLVVTVVNSNLDRDTGINEANYCSGDTDEVGVPAVCGARKSKNGELVVFSQRFQARVP